MEEILKREREREMRGFSKGYRFLFRLKLFIDLAVSLYTLLLLLLTLIFDENTREFVDNRKKSSCI